MKSAVLQTLLGLPVAGAIALMASPAHAQFYSVPLSNGNFTLVRNGAGSANEFSGPITLLSPVGTIAVTGNPTLWGYQPGILVNANTPLGVFMENATGSVSLRDGRTANFGAGSSIGVEALATVSGTTNWNPNSTLPVGASATFLVQNGYLSFPEANLSAYPTPQFSIPVTNGTSFTVTVPVGAAPETFTINGVLSPIGTANLSLTYPLLVNPGNSSLFFPVQATDTNIRLGGALNGTVNLPDGRVATLDNLPVSLTATARVTAGQSPYIQPDVYNAPITIEGTLTGGTISVPESAFVVPTSPSQPPTPATSQITPASGNSQPSTTQVAAATVSSNRPAPVLESTQTQTSIQLGFTSELELGGEIGEFVNEKQQTGYVETIPDVDRSSLEYSRIHPMVNCYN